MRSRITAEYWLELTSICRFDQAQPTAFQLGDIVEVQASFVALPMRDNKAKLSMILHSISLLNKQFTQVREGSTQSRRHSLTTGARTRWSKNSPQ